MMYLKGVLLSDSPAEKFDMTAFTNNKAYKGSRRLGATKTTKSRNNRPFHYLSFILVTKFREYAGPQCP